MLCQKDTSEKLCCPAESQRSDVGSGYQTLSCRLEYNKTKLFRAEKRKPFCDHIADVPRKYTRQSVGKPQTSVDKCFFCDGQAGKGTLHEASTFELDASVRKCALKLEDKRLLAKLSGGDLIAQEAKYHVKCLASLYNKARGTKLNEDPDQDDVNHSIALAELVSYIEETLWTLLLHQCSS